MTVTQVNEILSRLTTDGETISVITYNDGTKIFYDKFDVTWIEIDEPDGSKSGIMKLISKRPSGTGKTLIKEKQYKDYAMIQSIDTHIVVNVNSI